MKKIAAIFAIVLVVITIAFTNRTIDIEASPELMTWKTSSEQFSFGEHNISYHDTKGSSKEVILMMHGFPTSSWDWRHVSTALSNNYRLISLDMLGFGFSDKPNKIYSIQEQADIKEALLAHLKITEINILAHDYGDIVAQELVARFNEREQGSDTLMIKSLVLLNGGIFPEQHNERTIQTLLKSPIGGFVSSLSTQTIFNKSFIPVFGEQTKPNQQELDDLWYLMTRQDGHQLNHRLVHYLADRFEFRDRWVGALQSTKIPTLFINGIADPVSGSDTVARYMELIPKPNVVKLENIGHYPHLEDPTSVIKHYTTFIESL